MFLTRDEVNKIKERYPAGTRIRLTHMDDKHSVPKGTLGTVTTVDDQGQLHMKWDNGSSLALITNVDEFTVLQESLQTPDLKVVIVEPGKHPRMEMIKDTLEEKQRIVDGYIEVLDLDDGAVLICNEVGKLIDLKANRKVGSDIIAGTFFIVGDDGSEKFVSLTDEQVDQYMKQFYEIEEHSQTEMLVDDYAILSSLGWKSMG